MVTKLTFAKHLFMAPPTCELTHTLLPPALIIRRPITRPHLAQPISPTSLLAVLCRVPALVLPLSKAGIQRTPPPLPLSRGQWVKTPFSSSTPLPLLARQLTWGTLTGINPSLGRLKVLVKKGMYVPLSVVTRLQPPRTPNVVVAPEDPLFLPLRTDPLKCPNVLSVR